jgi:cell division transport system permease protein
MFTPFIRVVKLAFQDLFRNLWLSMTTILILTLTLVSVQLLIAVNVTGNIALEELESRVDIRVQFAQGVGEAEVDGIRNRLLEEPGIVAIDHRSHAQVIEEFQSTHEGNAAVLDALAELDENPFGPELRIELRSTDDIAIVTSRLEDPELADRIVETGAADRAVLVERLGIITQRLRSAGIALSGLSFVVTLLIIINAIRIATYVRRDEVGIMKLVGAANWFVRTPFLLSGVVASGVATLIVLAGTMPALRALEPTAVAFLGPRGLDVALFFQQYLWKIAGAEFLALSFVTTVVSAIAIRKYLRV